MRLVLAAAAIAALVAASDGPGVLPEIGGAEHFPASLPPRRYVLVEFRRTGCRMCAAFEPILAEIARQMAADAPHAPAPSLSAGSAHRAPADGPVDDFECVGGLCTPRPGIIPSDSGDSDSDPASDAASKTARMRYGPEEWAARAPGRFRGATPAQFTCDPSQNTCYDLGLRMLPTLRLYWGAALVAERTGAAKLSVVLEWLAAELEAHQDPSSDP